MIPQATVEFATPLLVDVPASTWDLLFSWLPSTADTCSGSACQPPLSGMVFYALAPLFVLGLTRELRSKVGDDPENSSSSSADSIDTMEDSSSAVDDELGGGSSEQSIVGQAVGVVMSVYGFLKVPEEEDFEEEEDTSTVDSLVDEPDEDGPEYDEADVVAGLDTDNERLDLTTNFEETLGEEYVEEFEDVDQEDLDDFAGATEGTPLPPQFEDEVDPEEWLSRVKDLHQRQIAAPVVSKGDTEYKVGEQYRRVMFAHKLPDVMPLAGLRGVMDDPSLHFDLTVHFSPNDPDSAASSAKDLYNSLEASVDVSAEEGDSLSAGDKSRRSQKVREFRSQIKENDQRPCTMSMYVCARADTKQELRDNVDRLRDAFRSDADIQLKTLERKQHKALVSASPAGIDPVRDEDIHVDPTHEILGQSFGALIASLSQSRKFEPSGHEWGLHSVQGHPIVKDPFDSPKNYNMVCVGESGTGKSLDMKRMALETKAVREDTLIIILDPLQGFYGLAEALDAKKVTIGGKQNLNPMEIRKPPEEYINSAAFDEEQQDPLTQKVDDVMDFVVNFVAQQPGLEMGDESQLLRSLILASYKQQGITHDVRTHDKESPTLMDVLNLAQHAKSNPEEWARGPQSPDDIRDQASKIGTILREFAPDGQYEHLATHSEEDPFGDSDVIYLDLSQEESSGGSGTGVMGQLMFSLAYEKCKQYNGPAMYIVDEARFLFREAETLDYLAQRVRHSRHYQTSIRFITQEMEDFFEFGKQAEGIINNSSFEVIHQHPDVDSWGDKFGLNDKHKEFVKNAATGKEKPYSQALVRFPEDDQWYPITVNLGDRMLAVADFDEQEDRYEDLPGKGKVIDESPIVRELQARLRHKEIVHEQVLEEIFEDFERPLWEMLSNEDIEMAIERIAQGENPRQVLYSLALERVEWLIETAGAPDGVAEKTVEELKQGIEESYNEAYTDQDRLTRDVDSEAIETAEAGD